MVPLLIDHPTVPAKCGLSREVVFHQGEEQDIKKTLLMIAHSILLFYAISDQKVISYGISMVFQFV